MPTKKRKAEELLRRGKPAMVPVAAGKVRAALNARGISTVTMADALLARGIKSSQQTISHIATGDGRGKRTHIEILEGGARETRFPPQ